MKMKYTDFVYSLAVMRLVVVWCSDACFGWERCSGHPSDFHGKETAHGILKTRVYRLIIIGLKIWFFLCAWRGVQPPSTSLH